MMKDGTISAARQHLNVFSNWELFAKSETPAFPVWMVNE
jgi:hypothetical protein